MSHVIIFCVLSCRHHSLTLTPTMLRGDAWVSMYACLCICVSVYLCVCAPLRLCAWASVRLCACSFQYLPLLYPLKMYSKGHRLPLFTRMLRRHLHVICTERVRLGAVVMMTSAVCVSAILRFFYVSHLLRSDSRLTLVSWYGTAIEYQYNRVTESRSRNVTK
jgi:hypothetical protein